MQRSPWLQLSSEDLHSGSLLVCRRVFKGGKVLDIAFMLVTFNSAGFIFGKSLIPTSLSTLLGKNLTTFKLFVAKFDQVPYNYT